MIPNIKNYIKQYNNNVNSRGINLAFFDGKNWLEESDGFINSTCQPTSAGIYYDIASLTKTFTATLLLLAISEKNNIELNTKAAHFLPFLKHFPQATLQQLLQHQTGFHIILPYNKTKNYTLNEISDVLFSKENIIIKPILQHEYSDLNYLFLGKILEELYSASLFTIFSSFLKKFELLEITFLPLENGVLPANIAATELAVQVGLPQDEKARWLGGVAGHAGLFATLNGLKKYTEYWLNNNFELNKQCYNLALQSYYPHNLASNYSPSFGLVWRNGMLGNIPNHAGFSGPSILLNPETGKAVVQTSNPHFPVRNIQNREEWKSWHRQISTDFLENKQVVK